MNTGTPTYTPAVKLTAAGMKELAQIAPSVGAQVKALAQERRTRNVRAKSFPAGHRYRLSEGERLTFYAPNGSALTTHMVGEHSLGAADDGVNYHVNGLTPPLPEGTWIVSEELFLGRWVIYVYYIGQLALSA